MAHLKPTPAGFKTQNGKWGFIHREDIPDREDNTKLYLRRWTILQTPIVGVLYHQIFRPDNDGRLHDHPWTFWTTPLSGGYTEKFSENPMSTDSETTQTRERKPGRVHHFKSGHAHQIIKLTKTPVRTLVVTGTKNRQWGFYENGKFVPTSGEPRPKPAKLKQPVKNVKNALTGRTRKILEKLPSPNRS